MIKNRCPLPKGEVMALLTGKQAACTKGGCGIVCSFKSGGREGKETGKPPSDAKPPCPRLF